MNPIKSPHDLLMEKAGLAPASPGMVNTGEQMLLNQMDILPHFAEGGSTNISPEDMLAALVAHGLIPQHLAEGGRPGIKELDDWILSQQDPYDFKPKMQAYEPGMREAFTDKIAPYLEKLGMDPRRAYEQASTITGRDTLLSPSTIFDPIAPFEAAEDLVKGNPITAGLTIAGFIPGATAAVKAIKKTKKLK